MKPYELTFIISSANSTEDSDSLKKEVESFIGEKGGVIVKSEKTVPQSLAYPIKKNNSGYFVSVEFQFEEKELKGLKEKLEKDAKVLRHFLTVKKAARKMKERRTRKPLTGSAGAKEKTPTDEVFTTKGKKETKKVEMQDIDEKLDKMLTE